MTEAQPSPDPPEGYTPLAMENFEHSYPGLIGPFFKLRETGGIRLGVRVRRHHCNLFGETHGGFLSALGDISLGACIYAAHEGPISISTVTLNIQYLSSARSGDWLEARARAERIGRSMAFSSVELVVGERRIALASAAFKVFSAQELESRTARAKFRPYF